MARRNISQTEKDTIVKMRDDGSSFQEIAKFLGWDKTINDAARSVASQYRKLSKQKKEDLDTDDPDNLLETMARSDRNKLLNKRLKNSPRYQTIIMRDFSPSEQKLFSFEYGQIIKSIDSINEAEEQMLFEALYHYILAHRAANVKSELEKCLQETLSGKWQKGDARYVTSIPSEYSREHLENSKRYENLMQKLKLSREQRVGQIKDSKKSLTDVARDLTTSESQARVADEIEKIERMTDKELLRMLESGYLYGLFGVKQ